MLRWIESFPSIQLMSLHFSARHSLSEDVVMFVPSRGIGVVVFTNGENGNAVIKKVVETLYPNGLYLATM